MSVRTIFQTEMSREFGPISRLLRETAQRVADSDARAAVALAADLRQTMNAFDFCVGLAANQLDSSMSVCVVKIIEDDTSLVMVNPRIVQTSGKKDKKRESCMSVWGWAGEVERRSVIEVEYQDLEMRQHHERYSGYQARIVQHEVDHLKGVIYSDHTPGELVRAHFFDGRSPVAP